jgi:xylulokinase
MALDCSTTACKAVAFDEHGTSIAAERRPYGRRSPRPGWQEQDPADWWAAVEDALAALTARLGPGDEPVALGLTHQRETFACLDADGAPLRPAILWLDTRSGEQVARLGTPDVHARSGKPPSTTPSLYKLAWLAEHEPEVLARTALVADVGAFLVGRLTGRVVTSWASADATGLLEMATLRWSPPLLAAAGLTAAQVPSLVAPGSPVGGLRPAVAARTGLPAGLPVVAGAGDGQCSGLGAGALEPGQAYLNLGTGLVLGVHVDAYRFDGALRTLAAALPGAYALEALLSGGALSIDWLHGVLGDLVDAVDPTLEAAAAAVPPGARGLLFLPYLNGAATPHWDPRAGGAFVGLDDGHGRGELYRAILEGLAYEQARAVELVEASTGVRVESVLVTGGAARSDLLRQILADVLERPVVWPAEREPTALGAAVLAAAGVELHGPVGVRATARAMTGGGRITDPDPGPRALYRAVGDVHRALFPALRGVFGRLAELRGAAPARPPADG